MPTIYYNPTVWVFNHIGITEMKRLIGKAICRLGLEDSAVRLFHAYSRLHPKYRRIRKSGLHCYQQFVNDGYLCFDVGANIGNHSEIFLRLGGEQGLRI